MIYTIIRSGYTIIHIDVHLDENGEGNMIVTSKAIGDSWNEAVKLSCTNLSKVGILEFCKMATSIIGIDITSAVYPNG